MKKQDQDQKNKDCDKQDTVCDQMTLCVIPADDKPDPSANNEVMSQITVDARPLLHNDGEICTQITQSNEKPPDLSRVDETISVGIENDEVVVTINQTSKHKIQLNGIGSYTWTKHKKLKITGSRQSILIILPLILILAVVLAMAGGK